jgi:Ca2+-binding EF-hand superfamily protein
MKTIAISLCLAFLLLSGTASAQNLTTGHSERLDMDDDGAVEGSEFDAFMSAAFAHLDTNKDGSLDASEMRELLTPAQVTDLDANSDGMVSRSEFVAQGQEDFRGADKDGDGQLN